MGAGAPDISIVLPAHNEAGNIAPIAAAIAQAMALAGSYEIMFVDDGSTDGTLAAIRAAARDPAIRYVSFTRNFGHQAALRAGHAPRARPRRDRDGLRLRASARADPEAGRGLERRARRSWRRGATTRAWRRPSGSPRSSTIAFLDAIGDVRIEPGSADYMLLDRAVVDIVNGMEDQDIFLRGLVRWLGFPLTTIPYQRGTRQQRRQQVLGGAHGGACALRHRGAQRAAVALRDLARARLRGCSSFLFVSMRS